MGTLSNINPKDFRKFLERQGCTYVKTEGGHEKWTRQDLTRPVIFQNHVKPMPEFVVRNLLKLLKVDRGTFEKMMQEL